MPDETATKPRRAKKKAQADPPTQAEEEIRALVGLCKAGKLFAVQEWIAAGKPVNPPPTERKGVQPQRPLDVAIDRGFHSLVEVLLKGGADLVYGQWSGSMHQALQMRRLDIVQLLVDHGGFDPAKIRMDAVFETWDPEIMEYFIDRGADVETNYPLADAFRNRIRTALRVFKRYQDRFPHFQKQANIALRYHCREGDLKWVSLMLWAGADPYEKGSEETTEDEDDEGTSALGFAALYEHFDIFKLKGIRLQPSHPAMHEVVEWAAKNDEGLSLIERLLKLGFNPNNQANGGCSAIQAYLNRMSWSLHLDLFGRLDRTSKVDSEESRQLMKAIHLLAKSGARWCPEDSRQISDARRSLLKLIPDYTLEFVWIMSKYKSCSKDAILDLVKTPNLKQHLAKQRERLQQLISKWS